MGRARAGIGGNAAVGFTFRLPGRPGGSNTGLGAGGCGSTTGLAVVPTTGVVIGRNGVVFTFARPVRPRRTCGSVVGRVVGNTAPGNTAPGNTAPEVAVGARQSVHSFAGRTVPDVTAGGADVERARVS